MRIYLEVRPEFEAMQFVMGEEVELCKWLWERYEVKARISFDVLENEPTNVTLDLRDGHITDRTFQVPVGYWILRDVQNERWLFLSDSEFKENYEPKAEAFDI